MSFDGEYYRVQGKSLPRVTRILKATAGSQALAVYQADNPVELELARQRGAAIDEWFAGAVQGKRVTIAPHFAKWTMRLRLVVPQVLSFGLPETQKVVYNLAARYAGTVDAITGSVLWELKSKDYVHPAAIGEHWLQAIAYQHACAYMKIPIDTLGLIIVTPKRAQVRYLGVGSRAYRVLEKTFLARLRAYRHET